MSKTISLLCGKAEPIAAQVIEELEKICGFPSEDVRLLGENSHKAARKLSDLGLDPHDTTAEELYWALAAKFDKDSRHFGQTLGLDKMEGSIKKLDAIVGFVEHAGMFEHLWALKPSAAKKLLRSDPPKNLMKLLNYRSIDSMLKRENVDELFAALPYAESKTWLIRQQRQKAKLTAADFDSKPVKVMLMPAKRWIKLSGSVPPVSRTADTGAVAVWPSANFSWKAGLALTAIIMKELEELKIQSNLLKLHQVNSRLSEIIHKDKRSVRDMFYVGGHQIVSWKALHYHFAGRPADEHPAELGPHLQPEDLHHHRAGLALAQIAPYCSWWKEAHLLHLHDDQPVSMNILDVALNKLAGRSFAERLLKHAQSELWDELMRRYMKFPSLSSRLLSQLEGQQMADGLFGLESKLVPEMAEAHV